MPWSTSGPKLSECSPLPAFERFLNLYRQSESILKKNIYLFFNIGLISRLYLFGTDQRFQFSICVCVLGCISWYEKEPLSLTEIVSPFTARFIFQTDKKEIIVL